MLVTTLTKKMAEDLTDYLLELGIRVRYLHSEVDTLERVEILRSLRLGEFDVLVGINLLREGLDLPEVSLVAILDADKEGFLRSETSLIQMMRPRRPQRRRPGRHVRRPGHRLDAQGDQRDATAGASCSSSTTREHGIDPQTIRKKVTDILEMVRARDGGDDVPAARGRGRGAGPAAVGVGRVRPRRRRRPTSSAG